jgi:hypothetical protein|tara:strand:+ start:863 stop:1000 length:138 start_codon:yes stop_codon:yes gene_type:complete
MRKNNFEFKKLNFFKKVTSIGDSNRSRPTNKHKKRMFKKYKGQGK